jgi:hypothetical protein
VRITVGTRPQTAAGVAALIESLDEIGWSEHEPRHEPAEEKPA